MLKSVYPNWRHLYRENLMLPTHRLDLYGYSFFEEESALFYKEEGRLRADSTKIISENSSPSSLEARMRALQADQSHNLKRRERSMLARLNDEVGSP